MWKKLGETFLSGLVAVLPFVATLAILVWLGVTMESWLGGLIQFILPESWYWPGMGLMLGIALVFGAGVLTRAVFFRQVFSWGEALLDRIPLVKTVYGALRDLMQFASPKAKREFKGVVTMEFGSPPVQLIGFVTRDDYQTLQRIPGTSEETIAVYLPLSYQIGGYMVLVPRSRVQTVDMSMEDAMRFAITAGLSINQDSR
jgi:uncharacterized membrane protein